MYNNGYFTRHVNDQVFIVVYNGAKKKVIAYETMLLLEALS